MRRLLLEQIGESLLKVLVMLAVIEQQYHQDALHNFCHK